MKQFWLLLKKPVVSNELSLLLKGCDIFSIFTVVNFKSKVLIELEPVKHFHLRLGESGVDKALGLQKLTTLFLS